MKNSFRLKIIWVTVVLTSFLFIMIAVLSYTFSMKQVNAERITLMEPLQEQAVNHLNVYLEYAEKIAGLVGENKELLQKVDAPTTDDYEEFKKYEMLENHLLQLTRLYTNIDSIMISSKSGEVVLSPNWYGYQRSDVKDINLYRVHEFTEALLTKQGKWVYVPLFNDRKETLFFGNRYIFVRPLTEDIAIAVSIAYETLKELTRSQSIYQFHIENTTSGFELRLSIDDDPEYQAMVRGNREALLYVLLALFITVTGLTTLFARKMMSPIEHLKKQLMEIKQVDNIQDFIAYRTSKTFSVSFRFKLFSYMFGLSVLGAALLYAVNYHYTSIQIKHNLQKYYQEYVHQIGNILEANLSYSAQASNMIFVDDSVQSLMHEADSRIKLDQELLKAFSYQQIDMRNIKYVNLYNKHGELLFSTINSLINNEPITKKSYFQQVEHSMGETLFLNEPKDIFGNDVLITSRKLFSLLERNTHLGYYVIAFDKNALRLTDSGIAAMSSEFLLTDRQGNEIYRKSSSNERIIPVKGIAQQSAGSLELSSNGQRYMVLYDTIQTPNWKMATALDESQFNEAQQEIMLFNGYMLLFMLAIILVVITLVSNRMAKPVRELIIQLRNAIQERWPDMRLPAVYGSYEIDELAGHLNDMIEKIQRLTRNLHSIELKNREAELSHLLQQINPHFLYNTLDTIKWMAIDMGGGPNRVSSIIGHLSIFLRSGIHTGMKMVTVREELMHIQAYLSIQELRYGDRIRIKWDVDEQVLTLPVLKFILQPLVENALLHGIDKKQRTDGWKGCLFIQIAAHEDQIRIVVADNGNGIEYGKRLMLESERTTDANLQKGIGLSNIRQRIQLVYGDKGTMSVTSRPLFWTKIQLSLPRIESIYENKEVMR